MLDRLNEETVIKDGVTVLDPAVGSGVFLVGFYRRIIEHLLASKTSRELNVGELRGLLLDNIYGIEQNSDACHVAAFSLYLTMLDYVSPRDRKRVAAGKDPETLFPPLVGTNIFAEDFFSGTEKFPGLPDKVHCVVGNPPWKNFKKLESSKAIKWHQIHKDFAPIGSNQAAELFTWKALREHLADDGVLSFLLPAKSFLNATSFGFRKLLTQDYSVFGAANFSHFRYRLFGLPTLYTRPHSRPRHPAMATFVRNRPPSSSDQIWVYSPLLVGQPMARGEWPWTIMMDRSEIQIFRQGYMARNSRGWPDALVLRPVDRQIKHHIESETAAGRVSLLGDLCRAVGAAISRGGSTTETGVDQRFLMPAPRDSTSTPPALYDPEIALPDLENFWGIGTEIAIQSRELNLDSEVSEISDKLGVRNFVLPPDQLAKAIGSYLHKFAGNVVLVSRNFKAIGFSELPVGLNSSWIAIYFDKPAETVTRKEKRFLQCIDRILSSETARYLVATTGRRWLLDRQNLEPRDLEALPVPLTGIDDPRLDELLELDQQKLENYLIRSLGLNSDLERAIQEFLYFRLDFKHGKTPDVALRRPAPHGISRYAAVLKRNMDGLLGREGAFVVASAFNYNLGVGAVVARFQEATDGGSRIEEVIESCDAALQTYETSSVNSFTDSLGTDYDPGTSSVRFVKPLEFYRWTVDSAVADSRQMMDAFVSGRG